MGRAQRIFGEGITYHVIANCNNGEFLFQENQDFILFLNYLRAAKNKFGFDLHGYQLLQSHIHLIIKTNEQAFLNVIMHWLCHSYAEHYNKIHGRKGHFWRNRYQAKIIGNDAYGLCCLRYLHRNVFEAGMVAQIEAWPWSCYPFYAFGTYNDLISPLPSYLGLAADNEKRRTIYRKWVETPFLSKETDRRLFQSKLRNNSRTQKMLIKTELAPFLNRLKSET